MNPSSEDKNERNKEDEDVFLSWLERNPALKQQYSRLDPEEMMLVRAYWLAGYWAGRLKVLRETSSKLPEVSH